MLIVALFYFIYKFEWFEKMSFVLVTSFFIYYLIYIFVPVAGPQFYFPAIGIDNVSKGIFPAIGDYFNYNQELLPGPGYQHGFFYSLVEGCIIWLISKENICYLISGAAVVVPASWLCPK